MKVFRNEKNKRAMKQLAKFRDEKKLTTEAINHFEKSIGFRSALSNKRTQALLGKNE